MAEPFSIVVGTFGIVRTLDAIIKGAYPLVSSNSSTVEDLRELREEFHAFEFIWAEAGRQIKADRDVVGVEFQNGYFTFTERTTAVMAQAYNDIVQFYRGETEKTKKDSNFLSLRGATAALRKTTISEEKEERLAAFLNQASIRLSRRRLVRAKDDLKFWLQMFSLARDSSRMRRVPSPQELHAARQLFIELSNSMIRQRAEEESTNQDPLVLSLYDETAQNSRHQDSPLHKIIRRHSPELFGTDSLGTSLSVEDGPSRPPANLSSISGSHVSQRQSVNIGERSEKIRGRGKARESDPQHTREDLIRAQENLRFSELNAAQRQVKYLEERLGDASEENLRLQDDLQRARNETDKVKENRNGWHASFQQRDQEYDKLSEHYEVLRAERAGHIQDLNRLQQLYDKARSELARLQTVSAQRENGNRALQQQLDALRNQRREETEATRVRHGELEAIAAEQTRTVNSFRRRLTASGKINDDLREDLARASAERKRELQAFNNQHATTIAENERTIADLVQERNELRQTLRGRDNEQRDAENRRSSRRARSNRRNLNQDNIRYNMNNEGTRNYTQEARIQHRPKRQKRTVIMEYNVPQADKRRSSKRGNKGFFRRVFGF